MSLKPTTSRPRSTPESRLIASALKRPGKSQAQAAEVVGVAAPVVYQWATGRRPVPHDKAIPLGIYLGEAPEAISAAYARNKVAESDNLALLPAADERDLRRPDQALARVENDNHAINMAIGAIVLVMTRHRPAEAKDLAALLKKKAPPHYRDRGLIHALLAVLERAK